MHNEAATLDPALDPASELLCEAIRRRKCVTTSYNRMAVTLAPHILYTRHGELHLDAVTVERDGAKPKEAKLGTFRLTGLGPLERTTKLFVPHASFSADGERYAGVTVCAVGR